MAVHYIYISILPVYIVTEQKVRSQAELEESDYRKHTTTCTFQPFLLATAPKEVRKAFRTVEKSNPKLVSLEEATSTVMLEKMSVVGNNAKERPVAATTFAVSGSGLSADEHGEIVPNNPALVAAQHVKSQPTPYVTVNGFSGPAKVNNVMHKEAPTTTGRIKVRPNRSAELLKQYRNAQKGMDTKRSDAENDDAFGSGAREEIRKKKLAEIAVSSCSASNDSTKNSDASANSIASNISKKYGKYLEPFDEDNDAYISNYYRNDTQLQTQVEVRPEVPKYTIRHSRYAPNSYSGAFYQKYVNYKQKVAKETAQSGRENEWGIDGSERNIPHYTIDNLGQEMHNNSSINRTQNGNTPEYDLDLELDLKLDLDDLAYNPNY